MCVVAVSDDVVAGDVIADGGGGVDVGVDVCVGVVGDDAAIGGAVGCITDVGDVVVCTSGVCGGNRGVRWWEYRY